MNVAKDDLVRLTLLGLPKSWHSYEDSVNGREKLLNWECLWSDLVHEEISHNIRDGTSSKGEDDENFSLDIKEKKGKWKKYQTKLESIQGGKKKDLSKTNAYIVMNSGTMPRSVHRKRKIIIP